LPVLIFRRKSKWQKTWHVSVVVGVIGTKVQQPQPRMAKTVTIIIPQATGQKLGNVHLSGCVASHAAKAGGITQVLVTETEGKK